MSVAASTMRSLHVSSQRCAQPQRSHRNTGSSLQFHVAMALESLAWSYRRGQHIREAATLGCTMLERNHWCRAAPAARHLPGSGAKVGRPGQPWSTVSGQGRKPRAARHAARLRPAPGSARLLPSRLGALGTSDRRPTVICSAECGRRQVSS
jgi:hypothetical protein